MKFLTKKATPHQGGVTNPEPLYFNYELITKRTKEHFYFVYDSELNIWFIELKAFVIKYENGQWCYNIGCNDGTLLVGLTGCADEYAKDIFPKTDNSDFTVIKIPVYNENMTNTL